MEISIGRIYFKKQGENRNHEPLGCSEDGMREHDIVRTGKGSHGQRGESNAEEKR